jgi:hypothetical protein
LGLTICGAQAQTVRTNRVRETTSAIGDLMLRRVLLILSVVGFLASVALWGVSYSSKLVFVQSETICILEHGAITLHMTGVRPVRDTSDLIRANCNTTGGGYRSIQFSLWIPAVIAATSTWMSASPQRRHYRREKRRRLGLCVACGYNLTGSPGPCSECGQERG